MTWRRSDPREYAVKRGIEVMYIIVWTQNRCYTAEVDVSDNYYCNYCVSIDAEEIKSVWADDKWPDLLWIATPMPSEEANEN